MSLNKSPNRSGKSQKTVSKGTGGRGVEGVGRGGVARSGKVTFRREKSKKVKQSEIGLQTSQEKLRNKSETVPKNVSNQVSQDFRPADTCLQGVDCCIVFLKTFYYSVHMPRNSFI